MGNTKSSIYEIIAHQILFEKGFYKPKYEDFYYIDKDWYEQLCEYVDKKEIERNIDKDLMSIKFTETHEITFNKWFPKFKEINIPQKFNKTINYIMLSNIEDNTNYQIVDTSKYIKINKEFYKELIKYYKDENKIKCELNERIIIYNEIKKKCDEKFIKGEKESIDIKLVDYFKNDNSIILFSSQKEEIENYKKVYNEPILNAKIDKLKNDDFYLILIISDENMEIKNYLFGTMGLPNIGNNCFMNCCIQCLSNIFPLTKYFLFDKYEDDININNPLGSEGKVVTSYVKLLRILWTQKIDVTFKNNKKCYYFDQFDHLEILNTFKNLKDEIAKNNMLYNDYEKHDAIEFFLYFIDIIHEDLNRVKSKNYEVNLFDEPKDEREEYERKYNLFKAINNSIITDIFYGMTKTTICCLQCKKEFHTFEPYDILTLPLKKSPYAITKKQAVELIKNKGKQKNNFNFPGKNNFYFCKCIIVPYDNNQAKTVIIYPIKKREYDKIKINDIYSNIMYLFNLNSNDIVPAIITEYNYYYQFICSGDEYLYEVFKRPDNLKIYFVQINLRIKELKIIPEMNNDKKLFNLFQKQNILRESDIFSIGEDIMGSYMTIFSNKTKINNLSFVKLISMRKNENKLEIVNIPKIISYSEEDRITIVYSQINNCFQLNKNQFIKLGDFNQNHLEILDDLDLYISQNQNLEVPFILFYKIERSYHNIRSSIYSTKEYYIKIPYCTLNLKEFSQIIKNNILTKEKYKSYFLRDYRIIIVWLNYYEKIKMIENSFLLENMKVINPYEEMEKMIDTEKSISKENDNFLKLYDLLNFYQVNELYENSNSWFCENCNSYVKAIKNTSLYSLPEVLIIHFQRKVNSIYNKIKITFPIEDLKMNGYCYDNNSKTKIYDLIGIINFTGTNITGHYNVFCKNDIQKKWFLFQDSICYFVENIKDEIKYDEVYALVYKNRYFQKV